VGPPCGHQGQAELGTAVVTGLIGSLPNQIAALAKGEMSLADIGKDMLMNAGISALTHGMNVGIDPSKLSQLRTMVNKVISTAGAVGLQSMLPAPTRRCHIRPRRRWACPASSSCG